MAKAGAVKSAAALAPGFEDKIRDARYQVIANQFLVTFDSGKEYAFSRSLLECDDASGVRQQIRSAVGPRSVRS
jgi:hypothetical protein